MKKIKELKANKRSVRVRKRVSFDIVESGFLNVKVETLGDVVELMILLVSEELPYVDQELTKKIKKMLIHFNEFKFTRYQFNRGKETSEKILVKDGTLSDLNFATRQWVESFLCSNDYPLLTTYALAVSKFTESHCYGCYIWGNPGAEIEGIFKDKFKASRNNEFRFLNDPQFKKDVTSQIGHSLAVAKIPGWASIVFDRSDKVLEGETDILFKIQRCHLSSGIHDYSRFSVNTERKEFDLFEDFKFRGWLILSVQKDDEEKIIELEGEIPVQWITHIHNYRLKTIEDALPECSSFL